MKVDRFVVSFKHPPGVNNARLVEYIKREVQAGVGQLSPDDPLFELDRNSVRVTVFKEVVK